MKNSLICLILLFLLPVFIQAQEMNLLDMDLDMLDSIFDEPSFETPVKEEPVRETTTAPIIQNLRRRGIELDASYEFVGGMNPGWEVYPWDIQDDEHFSWAIAVNMSSSLSINAQLSERFRARSVFTYGLPSFDLTMGEFFFDYNFIDRVFLRAGKFEQSWGISPNFGFTNLLSRITMIPPEKGEGENKVVSDLTGTSYIMKIDVPIGIGGLQLLALTRAHITSTVIPTRDEFGYGGKYNLAFSWADFTLGAFYQYGMATRGFLSVKTNLWNTDFYSEWLLINNNHLPEDYELYNTKNISYNFGVSRSFFNDKLEINAEYFNNGEEDTEYFVPETNFRKQETSPFLFEHNFALNLLYRYEGRFNLRFFTGLLYASTDRRFITITDEEGNSENINATLKEPSFSIIPGFKMTPFPNLDVTLLIPIAIGFGEPEARTGYYYRTARNVKDEHRPLSLVLLITFSGSVQASHYY